uniref:Calmodulin n=1 Tax=Erythrolobus madagascarensis TaxID=708628 RepID=A0A7S0XN50_9RHOD
MTDESMGNALQGCVSAPDEKAPVRKSKSQDLSNKNVGASSATGARVASGSAVPPPPGHPSPALKPKSASMGAGSAAMSNAAAGQANSGSTQSKPMPTIRAPQVGPKPKSPPRSPRAAVSPPPQAKSPGTTSPAGILSPKLRMQNLVAVRNRVIEDALPDIYSSYSMGKTLGEGAYGTVYMCRHRGTGADYACKTLAKSKMTKMDREWVRKEAQILRLCSDHPNVVGFVEAYEDDKAVHLLMEVCSGGELFDRIVSKGHYSEKDAATLMRTMLQTVAFIHSKGVVHRDLKPENFLLDSDTEHAQIKLTDFGVSEYLRKGEYLNEKVGSPTYVAPDVIMGRYDFGADIWSLGVICYILLCGRTPFFGRTEREEFERARSGKISMSKEPWPRVSEEAKDLVRKMLTVNVQKRPDAETLLKHPWIAEDGVAKDTNLGDVVFSGLKHYSDMNRLKKRALQLMASSLQEEDVRHLKKLFNEIDADGSGSVTLNELSVAMKQAGTPVSEEELLKLVQSYDVDGDGEIDITEFISAMTDISKLNTVDNIRRAFAAFDTDNSGTISAEEVLQALKDVANMDIEKAREVVREADKNGDGEIDWPEFYEMMMKHDDALQQAAVRKATWDG